MSGISSFYREERPGHDMRFNIALAFYCFRSVVGISDIMAGEPSLLAQGKWIAPGQKLDGTHYVLTGMSRVGWANTLFFVLNHPLMLCF